LATIRPSDPLSIVGECVGDLAKSVVGLKSRPQQADQAISELPKTLRKSVDYPDKQPGSGPRLLREELNSPNLQTDTDL
jgi:hypothetical protein